MGCELLTSILKNKKEEVFMGINLWPLQTDWVAANA